jgi:hypothetical protein
MGAPARRASDMNTTPRRHGATGGSEANTLPSGTVEGSPGGGWATRAFYNLLGLRGPEAPLARPTGRD